MLINAYNLFGMQLNREVLTRVFASQLPDLEQGPYEIDFSGCIIDYQATSKIIDAALEKLLRAAPPLELIVVFNVAFRQRLFLKWLFLGSKLLNLGSGTSGDQEVEVRIGNGLRALGVVCHIDIVDIKSGMRIRRDSYGQ